MSSLPHVHQATPRAAVERYFEVSLYLLVLTGFATVVLTGKLDLLSTLLVSIAIAYRGLLLLRGRTIVIPVRYTNYLTFVFVAFYIFDFFFLSAQFVPATVHLVLLIMVVKLFAVQRERDHVYLAVIAFLMVLASAVLTVDSIFLGVFSVFMLLSVSTFVSMEMKRSAARATAALHSSPVQAARMSRALAGTAAMLMLGILLGAGVIFFLLPRVSGGYLSKYAPRNQFASGFSQDVELGQIGQIQQSQAVVMRVQIDGDAIGAHDLFWRGVALSSFDGKRWSNKKIGGNVRHNLAGTYDLTALYAAIPDTPAVAIRYRVLMEPIENNVFFLADRPQWLLGQYREIGVDDEHSVFNRDLRRPITTYTGLSNVARPALSTLRAPGPETPPRIAHIYLQLPAVDRRIAELARQVTQADPTPYDKAAAVERYLKTQFRYTLDLGSVAPDDPIAHFLFVRKEGHCEYFASAMTVMLRSLGIPARIVNGFRGGEFNDVTGSYIVRAADAHSWVEAYLPGTGWVTFDPTPPGQRPLATGWHRVLLYMDALREFWAEWVVNYDFQHQQSLTIGFVRKSRFAARDIRVWWRAKYRELLETFRNVQTRAAERPREVGVWSLLGVAVIMLLFSLPRMWRRARENRLARSPEKNPDVAASIWYRRMLRLLARRGWQKAPAQTPQEYVSTIGDELLRARLADFTAHYERARFGQSASDAARLPEIFEVVKTGPLNPKKPA